MQSSIIFGGGSPGASADVLALNGVAGHVAQGAGYRRRIVRIGVESAAVAEGDARIGALFRCRGQDGAPGGEDAVKLAGHDHTLQSAYYRDDVRIGRGQDRRNLARWEERQQPHVPGTLGQRLYLASLRSVPDKHQANAFALELVDGADHRLPGPGEAEIARMDEHEAGPVA